MVTTQEEIRSWFKRGVTKGATHMIVVVDTYDWEDYPVYVEPTQDARKIAEEYSGKNMQRVMEVYKLSMDMETQLAQHRAFNY